MLDLSALLFTRLSMPGSFVASTWVVYSRSPGFYIAYRAIYLITEVANFVFV